MKKFVFAFVFLITFLYAIFPASADSIRERCKGEWGTNYEMLKYCIDGQEKAKSNVESRSVSDEIMRHCKGEWGTNYEMLKYCIDGQEKAKRELGL